MYWIAVFIAFIAGRALYYAIRRSVLDGEYFKADSFLSADSSLAALESGWLAMAIGCIWISQVFLSENFAWLLGLAGGALLTFVYDALHGAKLDEKARDIGCLLFFCIILMATVAFCIYAIGGAAGWFFS